MRARFFGMRRGLPFEQASTGNLLAIDSPADCVDHQPRLMSEEYNLQRQLRGVGSHVAPDTPEVAGPGHASRMNQQSRCHMGVNRKGEWDQSEQCPPKQPTGKDRPT